jgi:hypothetical protein
MRARPWSPRSDDFIKAMKRKALRALYHEVEQRSGTVAATEAVLAAYRASRKAAR